MITKEKVVFCWSGGKDSAMALYELRRSQRYEVVALLTSVAEEFLRVSHHGVRAELLQRQAAAIGVPLDVLYLPASLSHPCTNAVYEDLMERVLLRYKAQGVVTVAFGDIFLQDLRAYREKNLARVGMTGLFPIWQRDTTELVHTCIELGFEAYLSCVEKKLGEAFAGRKLTSDLIAELPAGCDPCGEYGEYHTFVYHGPIFQRAVPVQVGQIVMRDQRYYADLLPAEVADAAALVAEDIPPLR